jgi:transcriptional regulator GlxA family with amidase domain
MGRDTGEWRDETGGDGMGRPHRFGIVLFDHFNAMATTAFLDPFRAANYIAARALYDWILLSKDGNPVPASNGTTWHADMSALSRPIVDTVILSASWSPERHDAAVPAGWLRDLARMGTPVGGIDTGAVPLARLGLLDGYRATAHYEHLDGMRETFPRVAVEDALYIVDRDRITCAGGLAASDLALELARLHHGHDLANAAARYILHDRHRAGGESQTRPAAEPVRAVPHRGLLRAITAMESAVETPRRLPDIAKEAGLSLRHMERLFHRHTGRNPGAYYLDLRLDRARGLVTQTGMRVLEVAVACGFSSPEHFTRAYRKRFGLTPRDDRVEGRIPFQYRAVPAHAALSRPAGGSQQSDRHQDVVDARAAGLGRQGHPE